MAGGNPPAKPPEGTAEMNREDVEEEIRRLDEKIEEVQQRLPAHSVKPPIMAELFELEDRRATLVRVHEGLGREE